MVKATVDPASVSQARYGLIVEKDVEIPMRDGLSLKCDVFRPDDSGRFPVIMTLGPYPKDIHEDYGNKAEEHGPYMHWETANPEWWVPRGYVEIRVDSRGTGASPGFSDILSRQESEDYYDAIEWAASQPWSNGNVGLMGISYFAVNQWNVAGLDPPHLKAMIAWEGWGDLYRDSTHNGGILHDGFFDFWYRTRVVERTLGVNPPNWRQQFSPFFDHLQDHDLDGPFYRERSAHWERVKVPFLSVGNWGNREIHLRGNTEGFTRAASKDKRLRIHTGTHLGPFYRLEGRLDQIRYFDYWLKGIDNGLPNDPPVKLAIRTGPHEEEWRFENEWPLARTVWTKFHLDAIDGSLGPKPPAAKGKITYSAAGPRTDAFRGARFLSGPFVEDTEITGPVALVLWVSSTVDDMDIFAALHVIDPDGNEVLFPNGQNEPSAASKGWLRVSHRKLDPALSKPWRPYHSHDEIQRLTPGEPVEAQVEIIPTSNVVRRGYRLRVDILPWDDNPKTRYSHDNRVNWRGDNTIHSGGERESYLLVPVVPRG